MPICEACGAPVILTSPGDPKYDESAGREDQRVHVLEKQVADLLTLVPKLDDIAAGSLFRTANGCVAMKTEYGLPGDEQTPLCYVLESGECAHFSEKGQTPVQILTPRFDEDDS